MKLSLGKKDLIEFADSGLSEKIRAQLPEQLSAVGYPESAGKSVGVIFHAWEEIKRVGMYNYMSSVSDSDAVGDPARTLWKKGED